MNIQPTALRIFNLQTLQKLDRNIKSLVLSGGQVTAYLFDSQTRTWDSMPVNGPIFVVEREAPSLARYSFLILNRNNIKTLDVEINSDWILEDAETILICQPYRFLPRPEIYGLWFHDRNMKEQFYKTVAGIMARCQPVKQEQADAHRSISVSELFQTELQAQNPIKQEPELIRLNGLSTNNTHAPHMPPAEETGNNSNLIVKDIQSFLNEFNHQNGSLPETKPVQNSISVDLKNIQTSSLGQPQFFQNPNNATSNTNTNSNQAYHTLSTEPPRASSFPTSAAPNKNKTSSNKATLFSTSSPPFFKSTSNGSPSNTTRRTLSPASQPPVSRFTATTPLSQKNESLNQLQAQLQSQLQSQLHAFEINKKATTKEIQLYDRHPPTKFQPQDNQVSRFIISPDDVGSQILAHSLPFPLAHQSQQECVQTVSTTTTTHTVNHHWINSANHSLSSTPQFTSPQQQLQYVNYQTQNNSHASTCHVSSSNFSQMKNLQLQPHPTEQQQHVSHQHQFSLLQQMQLQQPKAPLIKSENDYNLRNSSEMYPRFKQENLLSSSPANVSGVISTSTQSFKSEGFKSSSNTNHTKLSPSKNAHDISKSLQSQLQFQLQTQLQSREML